MDRQRRKRRSEDQIAGTASDQRGSLRDALRKAALAVGVIGVAYFVARRFGASDADRPSHGEKTGFEDRGGSGGVTIEVDGDDEDIGDDGDDGEDDSENGVNAGEDDDTDLPGEDRSPAEIQERAEEDAHEEPAEPGEMTVDEDVVEDVIEGEENEESEE